MSYYYIDKDLDISPHEMIPTISTRTTIYIPKFSLINGSMLIIAMYNVIYKQHA